MAILRVAMALIVLLLAACQSTQVVMNQPLPRDAAGAPVYTPGYTLPGLIKDPDNEILVALAFSGGGKRSAAFAYGTLKGLRAMQVVDRGRARPLLSDVLYISSVSGGGFPAAYYGLYRDRIFTDFDHDFLRRDINAFIFGIFLLPWNWEWLINPLFGTNDAMAEVYNRLMYHGATYADLYRRGLPMISVDATDIAGSTAFPFNQSSFDLLCSNLLDFPVARAVAASAGFPILFSPITLESHREQCLNYPPPGAPPPGAADGALSRRSALAANDARLMDPQRTAYVHLLDGGIADNLALRSLSNALITVDDNDEIIRKLARHTRRVIVISVDGQAATDPTLGQRRIVSGIGQIFAAVSGAQINSYNFETLLLADQQVGALTDKIRTARCAEAKTIDGHDCGDVKGALIQISLAGIADAEKRRRLQAIPTSLTLPDDDVDALVAEGEYLVQTDPKLRSLISDLQPQATARR